MQKREGYIDIYKGLLILITAIGHSSFCRASWIVVIYSFHMIAFFSAYGAGYNLDAHCERLNNAGGFGSFVAKRSRRLVIPYFIWGLIYNSPTWEILLLLAYGSSETLTEAGGLSSLWFLPCMFVSVIFFEAFVFFCVKRSSNEKNRRWMILGFSALMILIGFLLPEFKAGETVAGFQTGYPWEIKSAFMACGFIGLGCLLSGIIKAVRNGKGRLWIYALSFALSVVILICTCKLNVSYFAPAKHVALSRAIYGNPLLFLLDSVCGIIGVFSLSLMIDELFDHSLVFVKRIFCALGVNTMGIFLIHKGILLRAGRILSDRFGRNIVWLPVTVIFSVGISYLLTKCIRAFIPELLGEERKK